MRAPGGVAWLLGVAILAISTSAILIKAITLPPALLGFYRFFLTFLLFLPMLIRQRQYAVLDKKLWGFILLAGIFLGLHMWAWILSLQETSIASSVIVVSVNPVFTLILSSIFLKERINRLALLGLILAVLGIVWVGFGDLSISLQAVWGDFFSLLGAFFVSVYFLIGRFVRDRVDLWVYSESVYGVASLFLLIVAWQSGQLSMIPSGPNWLILLLLVLLPTFLGHTLFSYVLKFVSATTVSMVVLAEPMGTTLLAWLIYGTPPTLNQWMAAIFVVGGLLLYLRQSNLRNAVARSDDATTAIPVDPF